MEGSSNGGFKLETRWKIEITSSSWYWHLFLVTKKRKRSRWTWKKIIVSKIKQKKGSAYSSPFHLNDKD